MIIINVLLTLIFLSIIAVLFYLYRLVKAKDEKENVVKTMENNKGLEVRYGVLGNYISEMDLKHATEKLEHSFYRTKTNFMLDELISVRGGLGTEKANQYKNILMNNLVTKKYDFIFKKKKVSIK